MKPGCSAGRCRRRLWVGYENLAEKVPQAPTLCTVCPDMHCYDVKLHNERIRTLNSHTHRSSLTFPIHLLRINLSAKSARLDSLAAVWTGSGDGTNQESRCCSFSALREGLCSVWGAHQSVKSHHGSVIQLDHDTQKFRFIAQRACLPPVFRTPTCGIMHQIVTHSGREQRRHDYNTTKTTLLHDA